MKVSKDIRFRVYVTFLLMVLFGVAIIYKAAYVQAKEGRELLADESKLHTKLDTIYAERGNIYSEDGSLLATTIPQFDLRIDFKAINKDTFYHYLESLSHELANILKDNSKSEYKQVLATEYEKGSRYYLLKRKASYEQYIAVRQLMPFKKGQNKGGFIAEPNNKRVNPYGLLANRVIGLWRKNAQNVGIEREYNEYLSGSNGMRWLRCISGGAWVPIDGSEVDPQNGKDVLTTIDINIQDVAETALLHQVEKEEAEFGTCIVMEVKTGKIKAIANLGRQEDGTYYEDFNYALKLIEPGSTFKLVSLIALYRDKLIDMNTKVNCQGGAARFGPYTIRDSHAGLGVLSIKDAFAQSSNVAFAKLIHENFKNNIVSYWNTLHDLHLDQKTGIGLAGESKARFPKDSVSKGRFGLAFMGMGYQAMITPLHTCMIYNMIANNGKLMKPYLVNGVKEYGTDVLVNSPEILKDNILDSVSLAEIKECMHHVVEGGTGKALQNPYYSICGKTGTAQLADVKMKKNPDGTVTKEHITYKDRMYHGSFCGFFPKEDPQYTICVVLRTKKGSSNYYGGQIALPVFKEVANRLYAIKMHQPKDIADRDQVNIPLQPKSLKVEEYNKVALSLGLKPMQAESGMWFKPSSDSTATKLISNDLYLHSKLVPDVKGMSMRDAVYTLERAGLKVKTVGKGKVVAQSLLDGIEIKGGEQIIITLG